MPQRAALPPCRYDQVADGQGGTFRDEVAVDLIRQHNEEARQLNEAEEAEQEPGAPVAALDKAGPPKRDAARTFAGR